MQNKKFTLVYTLFLGIGFYLLFSSNSGGYHSNLTGSTGSTCANCHNGGSAGGSVALAGAPSSYGLNQLYTMTLTVADTDMVAAGFQITAIRAGASVGTFSPTAGTRLTSGFNGLTHNAPQSEVGGETNWTINWTSPTSGSGAVTFYYVGNAVDLGGGTGGDDVYAGTSAAIPLPIRLSVFDVKVKNQTAMLSWNSETEQNASHFVVEKMDKNERFVEIGKVAAKAGAGKGERYEFEETLENGGNRVFYYRLKMVDKDGSVDYSPTKSVRVANKQSVAVYPTMLRQNNLLHIENQEDSDVLMSIFDMKGQLVQAANIQKGQNELAISLQNGIYIVKIGAYTERIVVAK